MNCRTYLQLFSIICLAIGSSLMPPAAWAAPNCEITDIDAGPPLTVEFTVQDNSVYGLTEITVLEAVNATVDVPSFTLTYSPVIVTATRINENADFRVVLEAENGRGETSTCQYEVIANTPPNCAVTSQDPGPPFSVEFTIQDTDDGLQAIEVIGSENATVSIPSFSPGQTSPVIVTATRVDEGSAFGVMLLARDMSGETTTCEFSQQAPPENNPPTCFITSQDPGPPLTVQFTIRDIDDGLQTIRIIGSENADVSIPGFSPGTTNPVVVTVTRLDPNSTFGVVLEAVDTKGASTSCEFAQPATPDNTPPTCDLTSEFPGPPSEVEFTIQDTESGLQAVEVVNAINADVNIPGFTPGTTNPVVVTVSQISSNLEFSVQLEAIDMQGNVSTCRYPEVSVSRNRPEIDAVGEDSTLIFNGFIIDRIVENGMDSSGRKINEFSDFTSEFFSASSPGMANDPCYSTSGTNYMSVLTPGFTEAIYDWHITLQMTPGADLMVNIYSCALKSGEADVWTGARQTGTYRTPWAPQETVFDKSANPRITVKAYPGPNAIPGFPAEGFFLDTRRLPGLDIFSLSEIPFSSQALAHEGIIVVLPKQGASNALGETVYELNRGDHIQITISIPRNSTADLWFGPENIFLNYLGIIGTEFTNLD